MCMSVAIYIERVPNRSSRPAVFLRESYRDDGKVKKRTIANLSDWPTARVEEFRSFLKGAKIGTKRRDAFELTRSRPHGNVAAVLSSLRRLGPHSMISRARSDKRDIIEALIVARARSWQPCTGCAKKP